MYDNAVTHCMHGALHTWHIASVAYCMSGILHVWDIACMTYCSVWYVCSMCGTLHARHIACVAYRMHGILHAQHIACVTCSTCGTLHAWHFACVVCVAYNMSGILHELLLLSHSSNPNYHLLRQLLIEAIIPCMSFISLTVFCNVCVHLIVGNNDQLEGRVDGARTSPPQNPRGGWVEKAGLGACSTR